MSGLAGIYHLDGRLADPILVKLMTDAISFRGPDGAGHWCNGPVGLGHRMFHTTSESLHERQPLLDESGQLCLTMDGRVDNRDELKATLRARGLTLRTDTDAEIVLRAYECWDDECPRHIIGDFALALWDGRKQHLFCARDPFGVRPLYYHTDGRTFRCGSELRQLLEDRSVPIEPNEGMIGEYLAGAINSREETLYRDIFRLPWGHILLVRPDGIQRKRYWDIDPAREIRYRRDAQYAEHFVEVFTQAVRCRLRSHRPIGAFLSGGLDSSSVVGVVQSLYRSGCVLDHGFETFSVVFPDLPCDESGYIQDVVRMWGVKSNAVWPPEPHASYYADYVSRYRDFATYPNDAILDPLKSLASTKGIRVLLTGFGGDNWLTGSLLHYADLLRRLRIPALIRQMRFDARVEGAVVPPRFPLFRLGLVPLIPPWARRGIKFILRRKDQAPLWIEPLFAKRTQLIERIRGQNAGPMFPSFAQQDVYRTATGGWASHGADKDDQSTSRFNIEQRHPFQDRRVVEFALALPESQRWRQDQTKFVLRQAMRGLLPETVRQRFTKAEFSVCVAQALEARGGERLFQSLAIASMGWVDEAQVCRMYQKMARLQAAGDDTYMDHVWPLWMIFGIDLWFKTVFLNWKVTSLEEHPRPVGAMQLVYGGG